MKYKKYHSYIDSGIDWLGEIPEHWEVKTLKYLIAKIIDNRGRTPIIEDTGIPMLEAKHINGTNTYNSNNFDKFISNESYKTFIRDDIEENDILFVTVGTIGKANLVNKNPNFVIAQNIIAFRPNNDINSRFFLNYLRSQEIKEAMNTTNKNSILDSIKISDFIQVRVSIPQIEEQRQIANFLDKATAKIDTLIEKQTKQIELLKEKRQAVISHAVTKGINPNVSMKDSGVEWLGVIPEHWEVKRSKFLFKIKKRISGKEGYQVLSITQQGIKEKDTESGAGQLSMDYSKYQFVYVGDFAMNHMDLLTGYVDITKYDGVISPDYRVFTLEDKNSHPNYYLYLYQNGYKNKIFYKYGQGSSQLGRWRLPTEQFNEFRFPYPPLEEQQQIANYLDEKTSKIDILIEKSNKSIELLKEKRTALISACVTCKIDVREEK